MASRLNPSLDGLDPVMLASAPESDEPADEYIKSRLTNVSGTFPESEQRH
jgi:hypothetical protein